MFCLKLYLSVICALPFNLTSRPILIKFSKWVYFKNNYEFFSYFKNLKGGDICYKKKKNTYYDFLKLLETSKYIIAQKVLPRDL